MVTWPLPALAMLASMWMALALAQRAMGVVNKVRENWLRDRRVRRKVASRRPGREGGPAFFPAFR
jgi:hypothetical protein